MNSRSRCYSELKLIDTFEERFRYLSLRGDVGRSTFGFDRWLNQTFYTSREWRQLRSLVIDRDQGCDLGVEGYDIHSNLLIHHINPMTVTDVLEHADWILDSEYLITTTQNTHNAIHYGDESLLRKRHVDRFAGDTRLW